MWVSYLEWGSFDFSGEDAFTAQVQTLMQNCLSLGCTTVIAQVRPFADALYPSARFPWSHVLSGAQGADPGFDPLAVLVREAHACGLQLEAWLNPYRVALNAATPGSFAENSLLYTHPDWVKANGEGYYLNPALPQVRDYICEGVAVVDRDDFNYFEVADAIKESILTLTKLTDKEMKRVKQRCFDLATKAEWSKFIRYYEQAFDIALRHAAERNQ